MSEVDEIDLLVQRLEALTEKTEEVSRRLREATERRRQLGARIEAHLSTLPPGVRVYRSRWDHKGFGFFSGSNIAEKSS